MEMPSRKVLVGRCQRTYRAGSRISKVRIRVTNKEDRVGLGIGADDRRDMVPEGAAFRIWSSRSPACDKNTSPSGHIKLDDEMRRAGVQDFEVLHQDVGAMLIKSPAFWQTTFVLHHVQLNHRDAQQYGSAHCAAG